MQQKKRWAAKQIAAIDPVLVAVTAEVREAGRAKDFDTLKKARAAQAVLQKGRVLVSRSIMDQRRPANKRAVDNLWAGLERARAHLIYVHTGECIKPERLGHGSVYWPRDLGCRAALLDPRVGDPCKQSYCDTCKEET
jgi:hypothetical protein